MPATHCRMETCRSQKELLIRAYQLACKAWQNYSGPFSRKDFTKPQLVACLCLREPMKLSYRKLEAHLYDVPDWLKAIGMQRVPDHNTLWRAFGELLTKSKIDKSLDLLAQLEQQVLNESMKVMPLTMDGTCYEPRHRSGHYDRVCRRMALKDGEKPGKYGRKVNLSRSKALRRMPKLSVAVSAATHRILALKVGIGNGSDAPDFVPLLKAAAKRVKVKVVVADAGYDSEANHVFAREQMNVRSIIPASIGRPTTKAPTGRHRRNMHHRFARQADKRLYRWRSQSETVNSMMKRNLGEYLRSILPRRRKQEMMLRCVVHNLMLGPEKGRR
jgi:IS5 family transposase